MFTVVFGCGRDKKHRQYFTDTKTEPEGKTLGSLIAPTPGVATAKRGGTLRGGVATPELSRSRPLDYLLPQSRKP